MTTQINDVLEQLGIARVPSNMKPHVDNYFGGCPHCGETDGFRNCREGLSVYAGDAKKWHARQAEINFGNGGMAAELHKAPNHTRNFGKSFSPANRLMIAYQHRHSF